MFVTSLVQGFGFTMVILVYFQKLYFLRRIMYNIKFAHLLCYTLGWDLLSNVRPCSYILELLTIDFNSEIYLIDESIWIAKFC